MKTEKKSEKLHTPYLSTFQSRNVDDFMSIFGSLHTPVEARLNISNPFEMSSEIVISGGMCISKTRSSDMDLKFNDVFDGYGLTLPSHGEFSVNGTGGSILEASPGFGLMVDSTHIVGASMREGSDFTRISVNTDEMHRRLAELTDQPFIRRIQFSPLVALSSCTAAMASDIVRTIQRGVIGDALLIKYPAAMASLREALLNLIVEGIPHSYSAQIQSRGSLPSPKNVKRAIEYMVAHATEPLRLSEIAFASGCSVRSLQSGFMQFKGVSPMAYLRMIRLSGVRAEILNGTGETKIAEVAYSWGFPHLSSFAAFYLKAFGESPSDTRRRCLGR